MAMNLKLLNLSIIICILANNLRAHASMDVLELGSSLTPASDPLLSASSSFTLSFRDPHLANSSSSTTTSSGNLFLAVSFVVNSSLNFPVWVANRNRSVSASASLTLSSSGDLLLLSDPVVPSSLIWKSNTADLGVVRAQLLDSGNLVLLNNRAEYVWQSFHYPTDTLLPGQDFTLNSTALTSNKKIGDFHAGRYSLDFISLLEHYNNQYDTIGNASTIMRFDDLGNITFYGSDPASSGIISNDHDVSSGMRRMTLDMDGNLRLYTWDANAAQWNGVWMLILSVCRDVRPGVCGSYGVCTYDPFEPTCICPQGFSVVDATDLSSGCAASHMIADNCSANSMFKFLEIENVDFPDNDYLILSALSIEECKKECLNSCKCVAALYSKIAGICTLKQKVENGFVLMDQSSRVFLKVVAADPSVSSPILDRATKWNPDQYLWQASVTYIEKTNTYFSTIVALAILIAIESMCFAATAARLITRSRKQLKLVQLGEELKAFPHAYSYEQLTMATENFSHKLGEGGFGTVYKGQLQSGKCIAVKQLEGLLQQEKQFRAEIMTIGRIHHINLLRLVGFCAEGSHRLLVYEYMEKGSLDQILLQESGKRDQQIEVLDWSTRFSICLGVARGIHYLHEECLNCILHCDIKPHNILLDSSYRAKVADFGLAYLHTRDQTVEMTTIRGTRGYLAPEWTSSLPITAKADVYSYGMLIMEIVSGRSNYLYSQSRDSVEDIGEKWCFPMWAYGKRIEEVVDARLRESSVDWQQADMVLKVAFGCIQADMNNRPTMGQVLQMLEGVLPLPLNVPPPSPISKDKGVNAITLSSPQGIAVEGTDEQTKSF